MNAVRQWLGPDAKCVVICGGKGSRLMPLSSDTAKSLVKVGDRTVLEVLTDFWSPHVSSYVFILNHFKETLLAEIRRLGVPFEVVEETGPPLGIANALCQARHLVQGRFVTVLGDCLCDGQFNLPAHQPEMGVGVARGTAAEVISRNYSVELEGDKILRVEEKPETVVNDLCGTGFYFFDQRIFHIIRHTPPSARRNKVELTDAIQAAIDSGIPMGPFLLDGRYLNLTFPADLEAAGELFD